MIKSIMALALAFTVQSFAAATPVASYYSQNQTRQWELIAQVVQTQKGELVVSFVAGCSATLRLEKNGELSGSCSIQTHHSTLLYIARLKPEASRGYVLYQKSLELGADAYERGEIRIAYAR